MARRAHDGPHAGYECSVEPSGSRYAWQAFDVSGAEPALIASGTSRWHWRASRKAEDACRAHLLDAQVRRAHEAREAVQRWAPVL